MDYPSVRFSFPDKGTYGTGKLCRLQFSSRLNTHPPVISRVCFEAREVVFEAVMPTAKQKSAVPGQYQPDSASAIHEAIWQGRSRASMHLNWTRSFLFKDSHSSCSPPESD
jgi:hypothetical protein